MQIRLLTEYDTTYDNTRFFISPTGNSHVRFLTIVNMSKLGAHPSVVGMRIYNAD